MEQQFLRFVADTLQNCKTKCAENVEKKNSWKYGDGIVGSKQNTNINFRYDRYARTSVICTHTLGVSKCVYFYASGTTNNIAVFFEVFSALLLYLCFIIYVCKFKNFSEKSAKFKITTKNTYLFFIYKTQIYMHSTFIYGCALWQQTH